MLKLKKTVVDDIAPVVSTRKANGTTIMTTPSKNIAPYIKKEKNEEEEKEKNTFFKKSSYFDDGYQFGDVTKSILGTVADVGTNIAKGIIGSGEELIDTASSLMLPLYNSQLSQNQTDAIAFNTLIGKNDQSDNIVKRYDTYKKETENSVKNIIKEDLYDEGKIAESLVSDKIKNKTGLDVEGGSVLGNKTTSLISSLGEAAVMKVVGTMFGGAAGNAVMGAMSMGRELEEALKSGASYGEAVASGMISAAATMASNQVFNGVKFGGETLTDKAVSTVATVLSGKVMQTLAKWGINTVGEGAEEVLEDLMSSVGKKLTYLNEKEFNEIFTKESAWDSFLGGMFMGGIMEGADIATHTIKGTNYVTGLTKIEQRVVDTEIDNRIKELEDSGEKVKRSKVHKEVMKDLEEGLISIDTIERALGGETYKRYKEATDNEAVVKEEFDVLNKMKQGDMTGEQSDRRDKLKKQLEEMNNSTVTSDLKKQLSDEVFNISKNTRLEESYREVERGKQAFTADLSKYDEKQGAIVKAAIESGVLNNTNKSHRFVDLVAKISADKGITFDFTNNRKLQESVFAVEGRDVSGYVVGGNVTVNVSSKRMLNSIVGHEIMHVFKDTDLYAPLTEALTAYSKSIGEYNSRLENTTSLYEGMDADINEELFADMVGDYIFADEDFVRRLSTENRNVFQKVYDEIKYLCKTATTASEEGRQLLKAKKMFEEIYREEVDIKNTADEGGVNVKYSLSVNAKNDLHNALYDKNYQNEVLLRDDTPSIMTSQRGVQNHKMVMNASHIRENIFTEEEARNLGLKVDNHTHYHGIGEDYFLKIIDSLDNVKEAYRGTKNATDTSRRENYFLLVTEFTDENGNIINVPVYIDETAQYNRVFIQTNKIATVFGRDDFRRYIQEQVKNNNLVKIKNKSITLSEADALIAPAYESSTLTNSISNSADNVKKKQLEIIEKVNPVPDTYHTWVRSVEDIKTLSETLEDSEWADYDEFIPDLSRDMIEEAIKSGQITVYSSYPIEQGVFVSPSYMEAESYSGSGKVYEKTVNIEDVAWIDPTQGMYANINADVSSKVNNNVKDVFGFEINKDVDVNEDLLEDISYYHPDAEIDVEGNITVYHRTSKANAEKIKQTGIMSAKEDALFFSSKESGYASDYGDTVLKFKIPSTELRLNDVFDGEVHLDLPLEYRNGGYRLDVSEYLVKDNNADYSLSAPGHTEQRRRARDIYGDDVSLDTSENIAPIREDVKKADSAEPVKATVAEKKKIAPIKEDLKASDKEKKFTTLDIIDDDIETEVKTEEVKVKTEEAKVKSEEAKVKSEEVSSVSVSLSDTSLDNIAKTVRKALSLTPAEKKTVKEIVSRYAESGKRDITALTEELKSSFAERSYKERVEEIADVKHALKGHKIYVPQYIKNGITDYSDFRRRNFGKLTLSNEGTSVDKVYEALSYSFPNFFPSDVENDIDRLLQMSEVAGMETYKDGVDFLSDESITETAELIDDVVNTYKEKSFAEEAERLEKEQNRPMKRSEYHGKIVEGIKSKFSAKGYDLDEVLDKAKNLSTFSTNDNTPQRVMEKALGYKEGQILADETVNKVAQNETEGIKWLNSFLDKKSGLLVQISKQYGIKPGSKESAAAQMYAEGFYVNELDEIIEYGDKELMQDFKDPQVRQKIKDLASDERIRTIYDETLEAINESRRRNLYPEIPRLDNYFLNFRALNDTFSRLGLPFNPNDIRAKDLPTDLNGVTDMLKPGQPYFASAKHREGIRTSFDLLGGLEKYLTSAKNQIYHIDDIQTLRALRNYIADTYGQAKGLESLDSLSDEDIQQRIERVYDSHLSTFAKFLNEEANVLAGKTTLIDRGLEGALGRRAITFLDNVNKQVGSNMVGFNVSSSLTNFLPVVQTFAKTNKAAFIKGVAQTAANKINSLYGKSDDFAENSPVIIRRKGAERFYRTPFQKAVEPGYILMSAVDDISTEVIARAKYNEFTAKGMSSEKAHIETDKWVSRLMGDRSLGQQPLLYNSKMLGLVTKFQLEVRNQLDSQFYDTIQEAKASTEDIENALLKNVKTAAKVTSTLFQLAAVQHIFGAAFENIAGYNPTFDIVEVLIKTLGLDDDEEDEDTISDNLTEGFMALLEDLPYTSTLTGGRIPISSALPIKELIEGKDEYGNDKPRLETLKEVAPYYILPTGYGQLKKTAKGLQMFSDKHPISGSYTDSGNLRFPVDKTTGNVLQAAVFGQYANENAREYFDEGYAPLKEKQIQEYIAVDMPVSEYRKYREGLSGLETLNEKGDYIGGLDLPVSKKNILINNIADRDEPIDMTDYGKYKDFQEFDFASRYNDKYQVLKDQGISVKDYKENYEKSVMIFTDDYSWAANNPDKYTFSKAVTSDVTEYKKYTSELSKFEADKDKNGESISGTKKKKQKEYIFSLPLEYGQKIILYRSLFSSKADKRTYNNDIIDYLKSREDLSYEDKVAILTELDFTVDENGYVKW